MNGAIIVVTPTQLTGDNYVEYVERIASGIDIVRPYRQADEQGELRSGPPSEEEMIDVELQMMEITIILNLTKETRDKVFGKSQYSLSRKMMDRALSGTDGQFFISYKPRDATEEAASEQIDLWVALREYIGRLSDHETQYHTWTSEDKSRYAVCCRHGRAAVMKGPKFIVVTANNVGSKVITQNFGTGDDTKFIAVMCDDAAMLKESDQWIVMVKLTAHKKVTVLWLFGDHSLLPNVTLHSSIFTNHSQLKVLSSSLNLELHLRARLNA